jgi:hypothetical protein
MATKQKLRLRCHGTDTRITLMHTHEKMKTCSPESDNAADDIIDTFTWLTDSTHC